MHSKRICSAEGHGRHEWRWRLIPTSMRTASTMSTPAFRHDGAGDQPASCGLVVNDDLSEVSKRTDTSTHISLT